MCCLRMLFYASLFKIVFKFFVFYTVLLYSLFYFIESIIYLLHIYILLHYVTIFQLKS